MWIERLTHSSTTEAIELAARFAEQRQRVLAENLANIDTPDFHSRSLDPEAFQASLRQALDEARETRRTQALVLRDNAQFSHDARGQVVAKPCEEPAPNVLFHDGTNARLEQLMADIAENALSYELTTNLLRGRHDGLLQAIRGRLT